MKSKSQPCQEVRTPHTPTLVRTVLSRLGFTHRPLSSSFLGIAFIGLKYISHKKELLRGLWVGFRVLNSDSRSPWKFRQDFWKKELDKCPEPHKAYLELPKHTFL